MIIDFLTADFSVYSGHTLCTIVLLTDVDTTSNHLDNPEIIKRIKWKSENIVDYNYIISGQTSIYYNSENIDYVAQNLTSTLRGTLQEANMMITLDTKNDNTFKKPWFNDKCLLAKRNIKNYYKVLKKNNYDDNSMYYYNQSKNYYKYLTNYYKALYEKDILEKMRNTKNSYDFWKTINKFKKFEKITINDVPLETWQQYFQNVYFPTPAIDIIKDNKIHPELDKNITIDELNKALKSLKNNKSSGTDEIPNETYKFLTPPWISYILNLFNLILSQEYIPPDWSKTLIKMIYKKGDTTNPENYRPIALENTILKLCITIIKNRLHTWIEKEGLIPEEQNGFRPARSCTDNLLI